MALPVEECAGDPAIRNRTTRIQSGRDSRARLGGQRVIPYPIMVKITVEYDEAAMILIEAICRFVYPELPMEEAFGQIIVDALREKQSE